MNNLQGNTISIGFNMPIFFWIKQREDVTRAEFSLESRARRPQLIRSQTAATVTQLYRSSQLAYRDRADSTTARLSRWRSQDFRVALTAYQSGKIDFLALSARCNGVTRRA